MKKEIKQKIKEFTAKVDEFTAKVDKAKIEFNNEAKSLFLSISEKFFLDNPEMESYSWTQYQNYFNDGDECHFYVYAEDCIEINGLECGEDDDALPQKLYEDLSDFIMAFPSDLMKDIFGNHKRVTVTKDEIKVEQYTDHA